MRKLTWPSKLSMLCDWAVAFALMKRVQTMIRRVLIFIIVTRGISPTSRRYGSILPLDRHPAAALAVCLSRCLSDAPIFTGENDCGRFAALTRTERLC